MTIKIYLVGGAVRDIILGKQPTDYDFVVVGATPEIMLEAGFTQVGNSFPVFLDKNGNEFALARTERKVGTGHNGFDCEWEGVTLEEDLSRRDLTINAMAILIYDERHDLRVIANGGVEYTPSMFRQPNQSVIHFEDATMDIRGKVLRHVSDAFSEDPLRVLRLHRLHSQLGEDWSIHEDTLELCYNLAATGELKTLTPERVWQEMEKALSSQHPSLFFSGLKYTGLFPEYNAMCNVPQKTKYHPEVWVDVHTNMVMDYAAEAYNDPEVVFAGLCHDFGKPVTFAKNGDALMHEQWGVSVVEEFCDKWRIPNSYRDLAVITCRYHTMVHSCLGRGKQNGLKAITIMRLFEETKAIQKYKRFNQFLNACEADAVGRGGDYSARDYLQAEYMFECLAAVCQMPTSEIAEEAIAKGKTGDKIGEAIRIERVKQIQKVKEKWLNEERV